MEEGRKKTILIGTIIVCFISAIVITLATHSGDSSGLEGLGTMMWVRCNNPKCYAEYEVDRKDYYQFVKENYIPTQSGPLPMVCTKCSEKSIYRAFKCPKCGLVFYPKQAGKGYEDTCPECGYSKLGQGEYKPIAEPEK